MTFAYAALLGPTAMSAVLVLGVLRQNESITTLTHGIIALFVFSGLGMIVGRIAESLVQQQTEAAFRNAVSRLQTKLESAEAAKQTEQTK